MGKKKINEGLLDTAVKGIVGLFFGKKLLDKAARNAAMRDPKVKKIVSSIKKDLAEFDRIMAEYE
jgi:hypothetical protein